MWLRKCSHVLGDLPQTPLKFPIQNSPTLFFVSFSFLLKYNWFVALYKFKVFSIKGLTKYTMKWLPHLVCWSSIISIDTKKRKTFLCVMRTQIYSQLSYITYSSMNCICHIVLYIVVLIYLVTESLYLWLLFVTIQKDDTFIDCVLDCCIFHFHDSFTSSPHFMYCLLLFKFYHLINQCLIIFQFYF